MKRPGFSVVQVIVAAMLVPAPALAGVTIEYAGTLEDPHAVATVVRIAQQAARKNHWRTELVHEPHAVDMRIIEEVESRYEGPIEGIVLYPSADCEPVSLKFGTDGVMSSDTKTQFAGVDVHMRIVDLLRKLEPLFASFSVTDEGDYWCSHDRARLAKLMSFTARVLRNPKTGGGTNVAPPPADVEPSDCQYTKPVARRH